MDSERPSKWRRLSSSRLVRIDPKDPCYNFNFLGLPLEIKLLIICRHLSVKDLLSMSLISKDYKHFIDQYFVREEVDAPRCLNDFEDLADRYVLSLRLDFDNQLKTSITTRERFFEVLKNLNFSKVKYVTLLYNKGNAAELTDGFNSDEAFFRSSMTFFPSISLCVFRNTIYLQSVDLTIFMCKSYFLVITILSDNAPHLREVTIRSTEGFLCHPFVEAKDNSKDDESEEKCYLSRSVFYLLSNTAITYLELVGIHKKFTIQSETHIDPYFLVLQSKTLKRLILSSSSMFTEDDIESMTIDCPNLLEMKVISEDSSPHCLFHVDQKFNGMAFLNSGLVISLALHCPRLELFNNMRVCNYPWFTIWDGYIEFYRYNLCSEKCGMYDYASILDEISDLEIDLP